MARADNRKQKITIEDIVIAIQNGNPEVVNVLNNYIGNIAAQVKISGRRVVSPELAQELKEAKESGVVDSFWVDEVEAEIKTVVDLNKKQREELAKLRAEQEKAQQEARVQEFKEGNV